MSTFGANPFSANPFGAPTNNNARPAPTNFGAPSTGRRVVRSAGAFSFGGAAATRPSTGSLFGDQNPNQQGQLATADVDSTESYGDVVDGGDAVTQTWDLEVPPASYGSTRFRYSLVKLNGTCPESVKVAQHFANGFPGARVTGAWRVQNKRLLQAFRTHGEDMKSELSADGLPPPQYQLGFHGTRRAEAMHSILQDGYDVIYSSHGVNAYGMGVYHARNASMSNQYSCPTPTELEQPDLCRTSTMLLNILQIGDTVEGNSQQVKPGVNPTSSHGRRYDTFTNGGDATNARIMVTTHNAQAYPAYILNFKRGA